MLVLSFLVQLIGATFLLLFAVRMVRTGIERAFGASFRRLVTGERSILQLVPVGVLLAILLQSSAAVTLLVAGFANSGAIAFASGLAVVLGGDLGSALIIQVLSLELDWLVPVLLTAGGVLFLKCSRRSLRQAGRITLGIAFILIALGLLREAVEPIRESAFLPAISSYLERDFVTAFIVGAALAFVMHSSVAAVLMCVAIIGAGALPMTVGASIVLGANLGSALIPIWLSRGMAPEALRIPVANLLIRGGAGAVAVAVVNYSSVLSHLGEFGGMGVAQSLVLLHILFNAMLLLALPICGRLENPINAFLPGPPEDPDQPAHHRSVLDEAALRKPHLAIACLRREVLRMSGIIGDMLSPVMDLYASFDKPRMEAIKAQDKIVNEALDRIRVYAADMRLDEMTKDQRKDSRALLDYAIALEAAGDVVVKRLLPLAESKSQNGESVQRTWRSRTQTHPSKGVRKTWPWLRMSWFPLMSKAHGCF